MMKGSDIDVITTNSPMSPPPYPQPPPAPHQTVHVIGDNTLTLTPALVVTNAVGPEPGPFVCKSCQQSIVTRVERKPTLKTHLLAILLCAVGCIPCMCIPYCIKTCKNADHYCPNCNAYIGSYSR